MHFHKWIMVLIIIAYKSTPVFQLRVGKVVHPHYTTRASCHVCSLVVALPVHKQCIDTCWYGHLTVAILYSITPKAWSYLNGLRSTRWSSSWKQTGQLPTQQLQRHTIRFPVLEQHRPSAPAVHWGLFIKQSSMKCCNEAKTLALLLTWKTSRIHWAVVSQRFLIIKNTFICRYVRTKKQTNNKNKMLWNSIQFYLYNVYYNTERVKMLRVQQDSLLLYIVV